MTGRIKVCGPGLIHTEDEFMSSDRESEDMWAGSSTLRMNSSHLTERMKVCGTGNMGGGGSSHPTPRMKARINKGLSPLDE